MQAAARSAERIPEMGARKGGDVFLPAYDEANEIDRVRELLGEFLIELGITRTVQVNAHDSDQHEGA